MQAHLVDKYITQSRLAVWLTVSLLTFLLLRASSPLAWQVATFGAAITLLWPFVRHQKTQPKMQQDAQEGQEHASGKSDEIDDTVPVAGDPLCHSIEIGLDLIVTTALIAVSGGFGSPFAPILFVVVLEALALLGQGAAIYTALAAALLTLVHFRSGLSPQSAILYGLATGTLFVSALLVGLVQRAALPTASGAGNRSSNGFSSRRNKTSATLLKAMDNEEMQRQLEASEKVQQQLRDKYREVTALHREQRAQLIRMRVAEQLFEASVGMRADDSDGKAAYRRLLRLVMETVEASGGVFWLRAQEGDVLAVQGVEGQVTDNIRLEKIVGIAALTPVEVRMLCEASLQRSLPGLPRPPRSRLDRQSPAPLLSPLSAELLPEGWNEALTGKRDDGPLSESAMLSEVMRSAEFISANEIRADDGERAFIDISPVSGMGAGDRSTANGQEGLRPCIGVVLLRGEITSAEPAGSILGAVGICGPRGQIKFASEVLDRLQSLSHPLSAAVSNIRQRVEARQRVQEVSQLYDLSRLTQSAMDKEQVYQKIVTQVVQALACDNCTLFLLEESEKDGAEWLEAKATRGSVVNLLDHITFARGQGVAGWVASRGQLLHIADLTQEANLLGIERMPLRVRSFVAMPLRVQDRAVGVLNVSHAQAYAFPPYEMQMIATLAEQISVTLERLEIVDTLETLLAG